MGRDGAGRNKTEDGTVSIYRGRNDTERRDGTERDGTGKGTWAQEGGIYSLLENAGNCIIRYADVAHAMQTLSKSHQHYLVYV